MLSLTLFVNDDSSTGGDGLSWETAHADLQAAFDHAAVLNADGDAANDVDAIWIAEGMYYPTAELEKGDPRSASFSLLDGVGLLGGFAGTEATLGERAADPTEHETILSGDIGVAGEDADNAYTVVYCGEEVAAEMDGVTVTGGVADGSSDDAHPERRYGGGVYSEGALAVTGATLVRNRAAGGGAIWAGSTLELTSCLVENNHASAGGGIRMMGSSEIAGTLTVIDSIIVNNTAGGDGGGISSNCTRVSVANSQLWGNDAGSNGGAIENYYGVLRLSNSTVWGNFADSGGGISNTLGDMFLTSCTISRNTAESAGGVYHFWPRKDIEINNTIIAGNRSADGEDIEFLAHDDASGSHNLIGAASETGRMTHGSDGNLIGTIEVPVIPGLSNWTILESGEWGYFLLQDSPALDAGANSLAVDFQDSPIELDVSGNPRIQNGTVDIGSHEGTATASPAQTYLVTSLADIVDAEDGQLTFREAFAAANRNVSVGDAPAGSSVEADTILFEEGLTGTVTLQGECLDVWSDLRIDGPGYDLLQFDAQNASRVFRFHAGVSASLTGLAIQGGCASSDQGLGIAANGGGILNAGALTVSHCVISDNSSASDGGGIANIGTLTMIGDLVMANTAEYDGGGIYNGGELTLTNCTVWQNRVLWVLGRGGGIYDAANSMTRIGNSIIAENRADNLERRDLFFDFLSSLDSASCSIIGIGGEGGRIENGMDGNLVGSIETPLDPMISHRTILDDGSWGVYLLSGSPALDAGDNTLAVDAAGQPIEIDLYGSARIENATVDIGCIEGAVAGTPGQVYTVTSLANVIDAADGELTFLEAFEAAGRNRPVGDAPAGSFAERDVIQLAEGISGTISSLSVPWEVVGDLHIEAPGPDLLVFDGGNDGDRVFEIGPSGRLSLENLAVTGGGIRNSGTLFGDGCVFSENTATNGGAIENLGEFSLVNCEVSRNSSVYHGGGIYSRGTAVIAGSLVESNHAGSTGGGIYHQGERLSLSGSTILRNKAVNEGGGIWSSSEDLSVIDSEIIANESGGSGGGVFNQDTASLLNCVIVGNRTASSAGGLYSNGSLELVGSTVTGNVAMNGVGGVRTRVSYSQVFVTNSIVAGNSAGVGDAIDISVEGNGSFTATHNLIGDGTGQTVLVNGENGNLVGTTENPLDPRFLRAPSPGPDGIWGTEDDDYGDLQLAADSPAWDAGDKSLLPADEFDMDGDGDTTEPLPLDILGNPRVDNGRVDMGAYEYQSGNLVPLVIDDTYFTDEDTPLVVDGIDLPTVFENDADPEGLPLTAVWASNPAHGILELNVDGTFTYEPDADWHGADWFTYIAYDGTGYSDPATVFVIVRAVNDPPILEPIGDFVLDEQTLLSFTAEASDSNDLFPAPVTFAATGLPDGATLDPETGAFSWTPDEAQDGVHSITIIATDGLDPDVFASETITVTVNEVNRPPYFEIEGSCAVEFGVPWSMRVQVLDPDLPANGIALDVEGLPDDVAYDAATGILSWTAGVEDVGDYAVTFRAEDDGEPSYRVAHHLTLSVRKGPMLHVDADAEAGGDGLTWATAFQDIQSAVDAAATINADAVPANDINQIWIAEGTYLPTAELEPGTVRSAAFSLIDGVTLCGGFVGTETKFAERGGDPMEHQTILSGDLGVVGDDADNAATVVYCGEGIEAGLDGLTITGGNADLGWSSSRPERRSGGGIYNNGAIEMTNCRVQDNRAYNHGGGAYITGEFSVTDSSFLANETSASGAGVYNAGYARFVGTLFHGNSSGVNSWGGAIRSDYGTLEIVSSSFLANAAARGGGIAQIGGDMTVMNGRFVANTAGQRGGGVYIAQHEGTTSIANSTFTANTATDVGGGFCADDSRRPRVVNSIVAGNDAAYNSDLRALLSADSGRNLIGTDPLFARNPNPGSNGEWGTEDDDFGDLRLTAYSPAIDFGLNDALPEGIIEDLAGSPRIYGDHVDLGAYEYQASPAEGRDAPSNVVTTDADILDFHDGMTSLREVVFHAESGDPAFSTVHFDASLDGATIALDGLPLTLAQSIHIDASALDSLTIDAGGFSRAFVVAGETTEVTLESLSITGGYAPDGGAIHSTNATLSLLECSLFGNEATMQGSAVCAASGSALIEDSDLSDNLGPCVVFAAEALTVRRTRVSNNPGGLRVSGTTVIEDSTFAANADSAIRVDDGETVVTNCRFEENAAYNGAAVYVDSGTVDLTGACFRENSAEYQGGAVYNDEGTVNVVDGLFVANSAAYGSGIYNDSGTARVANTTFSRNEAGTYGTIYSRADLVVTNSTFVDNWAYQGGGIFSFGSSTATTVNNSLFARNGRGTTSANVYASGGIFTGSNNLIDDGSGDAQPLLDGVDGNIVGTDTNRIDPRLSGLAPLENGRWGYYLLSGSPALNAGNNDLALDRFGEPLMADAAGGPRILDDIVDIGAIEGGPVPVPAQTYVVTSLESTIDPNDGVLTFMEAFEAAGLNQPVGDAPAGSLSETDVIRFVEGLTGTIVLDGEALTPAGDLRIEGPGADLLTFDAGKQSRVFEVDRSVSLALVGLTVTGGFAEDDGGGIASGGDLTVINCVIRGNEASGSTASGGGIYAYAQTGMAKLTLVNSTVVGNTAGNYGGGVSAAAELQVVNCTIAGNRAERGGGLSASLSIPGIATMENTIVARNLATSYPDLYAPSDSLTGSHNLIGDGSDQTVLAHGTDGNLVGTAEAPIDPVFLRSPSAGHDDTWSTLDDDFGDLRLRGDSPAVDAGAASSLPADVLDVDADGNLDEPLPLDLGRQARVYNDSPDLGAYETHPGVIAVNGFAHEPNEGQALLTFTVVVYPTQDTDLLLDYATSDGSATAGADYTTVSGVLTIPAGQTTGTIYVPIQGDWDAEGDETFLLNATGSLGETPLDLSAVGTIVEDDGRTYIVNSLDDTIAEDGLLTLREALEAANANSAVGDAPAGYAGPRVDYIHFDPALFADGPATILLDGTAFTISDDTLGLGPGADLLTLDAQSQSRVFEIGPSASATIVGLGVTGGYGDENGGGIYNEGTLTLLNCRVSGNEAAEHGGGIYSPFADPKPELTLVGCEIARNTARYGAGLYNNSRLTVTNCTIARNWADGGGGGMTTGGNGSVATLHNTIIAGNRASSDWNGVDISVGTGTLDGSHNVIGVTSRQEAFVHGIDGNFVGTYESPFDPRFLQDPIGPDGEWRTADDVVGDLRLRFDSPAIDAGDAATLPADAYDLDADGDIGETLSQDPARGDRIAGDGVDIGAYETQPGWHIVPARATEGDDGTVSIRFTVSLYPAQETDVTVDFATVDGSAVAGADYEFSSGTLTIPAGENFATVDVPVVGDQVLESDKTFLLKLSDSSGPAIVISEAAGTIVDNDGNTYVVDSLEDVVAADGLLTLREALQAANSNSAVGDAPAGISGPRTDHIVFDPALFADGPVSIALSGGVLTIADAVTIVGPGADLLAVDGAGQSGVFVVEQDVTANIAQITITGGNEAEDMGGGILNQGILTVADAVIRDNYARSGGGIMNYAREAQASLTLVDCMLLRNSAEFGGAVYSYGGAFSEDAFALLAVTSCEVLGNTAEHGGGIFSSAYGGFSDGISEVSIANSVFIGNAAASRSGAICTYCSTDGTCTTRIVNSTIAGNVAGSQGGAISRYLYSGDTTGMEIVGSIISLNSAPSIANMGELIEGGSRANLIGGDPLFVRNPSPGDDQIWGTEDDDYGDVTPSPESPAIDTGWNAAVPEGVETDVLGNPRFFGDRVDVGAVEAQTAPSPGREVPSAVVTTDSDVVDSYDGFISLREALFYVGTQQTQTQSITFAPSLDGATIALSGSPLEVCSSVTIDASAMESVTIDAGRRSRAFIVRGENEVVFDSLTITGGFDDSRGGGIYNSATLAVLNSTLVRNEADYYGGGVCNTGVLKIVNSSILGNAAGSCGGGVYSEGTADFTNVVIAGNRASGGAGIENRGSLVLSNVSITGNAASGYGGGVENSSRSHDDPAGTIALNNTIIAGNTAQTSPDIHYYGEAATGSYNLIGTRSLNGGTGNLGGTEESPLDPRFLRNPDPGPDGAWGTADDDYGNLTLCSDSPAVDAGDNSLIPPDAYDLDGDSDTVESVPYDRPGHPRIVNGTVDMGAIEVQPGIVVADLARLEGNRGSSMFRFEVTVFPASTTEIRVDYATSDLTATAGVDYEAVSGTLTIPAGAVGGVIEVPVIGDFDIEEDKAFLLTLSNSSGPIIVNTEVVGTIQDDDGVMYVVDSLADVVAEDGVVTLREAIEAANSNTVVGDAPAGSASPRMDYITFAPELFADGPATIILDNGPLVLTGHTSITSPAAEKLTIDANETGRVFSIEAGVRAEISGLTLTGGLTAEDGGGIENFGNLAVANCIFVENGAGTGGAIWNTGTLGADACLFHGNTAAGAGGAILNEGTCIVSASTFFENSTTDSSSAGGAVGGTGTLFVANSTFRHNSAISYGGALYARGTVTVTNSTFVENTAYRGGAIYNSSSSADVTLNNSLFVYNEAEYGPDLYYSAGALSAKNNIVSNGSDQPIRNSANGNFVGTETQPLYPLLTEWTQFDNGTWGLYLREGSLGIGDGDPTVCVDANGLPLAFDQAGNPRLDGDLVNIGATQTAPAVPSGVVYVVTSLAADSGADGVLTFWEALEAATTNEAVGDAPAGSWGERDTIRFAESLEGTIALSGEAIQLAGMLAIDTEGANEIVFDAGGQSRAFETEGGCDILLKGLTITGGSAVEGGAVYHDTGVLTLSEIVFLDNAAAEKGGALYNRSGQLLIDGSRFDMNTAGEYGGAIFNETGEITVEDTRFSANSTTNTMTDSGGGAIFTASGSLSVQDSIFDENQTSAGGNSSGGGAIHGRGSSLHVANSSFADNAAFDVRSGGGGAIFANSCDVAVVQCSFVRNRTTHPENNLVIGGGAVYLRSSTATIDGSLFTGNSAKHGGGVLVFGNTIVVSNSLFVGNAAVNGGAVAAYGSSSQLRLCITNSTISSNTASDRGGGIYKWYDNGSITLHNSIVAWNEAPSRSDIGYYESGAFGGSNNLISNGSGQSAFTNGEDGNLVGTAESPVDPLFVKDPSPGSDQVWGTADDDYGNLRLQMDSPAIDAGANSLLPDDTLDLDGDGDTREPIPYDYFRGVRVGSETVDIGAIERQPGIQVDPAVVYEGDAGQAVLRFAVRVYPPQLSDFTVDFATSDGSAIAGDDYVAASGTLTIPAGCGSATIDVAVLGDMESEPDETITLTLSNSSGVPLASPTASGTIIDDDGRIFVVDSLVTSSSADGVLTLYEAIHAANYNIPCGDAPSGCASPKFDKIVFSPELFEDGSGLRIPIPVPITLIDDIRIFGPGADLLTFDAYGMNQAVKIEAGTTAHLEGLTITGGHASDGGGGIRNEGCLTVQSCVVRGNSGADGGGIYNSGSLAVVGSVITGNTSDRGGGIRCEDDSSMLSVINSTICANTADEGGGIYANGADVTLVNSIVSLNDAEVEPDFDGIYQTGGAPALVGTDPGFLRNPDAGEDGVWGTDDDDYGDLRLEPFSPAFDTGLSGAVPLSLSLDIDGNPRIFGERVDIGAVEMQTAPAGGRETPSAVVTTAADGIDWYDGAISLREAVRYVELGMVDSPVVTFDPSLDGATIELTESELLLGGSLTVDASALDLLTVDAADRSRVARVSRGAHVTLVSLHFTGGLTSGAGGGIYNSGTLNLVNSTIARCMAREGGGIFNEGSLTLVNSILSANMATGRGGGLLNSGPFLLANSTIAGNRASESGGLHHSAMNRARIQNSIIAANVAETAPDIGDEKGTVAGSYSLIGDGSGQTTLTNGTDGNRVGTSENPYDPRFFRTPGPGPDGIWGSPDDDWGDLRLRSGSPAIGRGDDGLLPADLFDLDADGERDEPLPVDFSGNARLVGGNPDMGAHESAPGLYVTDACFSEESGSRSSLEFHVIAIPAPSTDILVDYTTVDGTARSGDDFTAVFGTLTIPAGESQGTIRVAVEDDRIRETIEAFELRLSNAVGIEIVDGAGLGVILDGDGETFLVDSLEDTVADDGLLTLREAALRAGDGASAGQLGRRTNYIFFDSMLFEDGAETLFLTGGDVELKGRTAVIGPGADLLVIDAQEESEIFFVDWGAVVSVESLTLSGGEDSWSSSRGSAIHNRGTLAIADAAFVDNNRGIFSDGTVSIDATVFKNNDGAGAICNHGGMTITNSFFFENVSARGGAIINYQGSILLTNCTFYGNTATEMGGALYNVGLGASIVANNCIIADNTAPTCPEINVYKGSVTGSHNLIGDGTGQSAFVDGADGNLVGSADSPLDPRFGEWMRFQNGMWGFPLLPESPAVDAGNSELAVDSTGTPLRNDLSGAERVIGTSVDIGAVEGGIPAPEGVTYIVTSLDSDTSADGVLTFWEAYHAATENRQVGDASAGSWSERDTIRFAETLEGTVELGGHALSLFGRLAIETEGDNRIVFDARSLSRVFEVADSDSEIVLDGLTITGGSSLGSGGGILNAANLSLVDCCVTRNTTGGQGGGLQNTGTVEITGCYFKDNTAELGGGVGNDGMLSVVSSTFRMNEATDYGGGIYNAGGAVLYVWNSVFTSNRTETNGGGISNWGTAAVTNSTLVHNGAYDGGGIFCSDSASSTSITNSIIAHNEGNLRPDVFRESGWIGGSFNLIGDGYIETGVSQDVFVNGIDGNQVGTAAEPLDPMLGDISRFSNGRWGYYLLPGSPALNGGSNALATDVDGNPIPFDQAGNERILGDAVDIGAFEGAPAVSQGIVYVVTSLDCDGSADGTLTFWEAYRAATENQPVGDAPAGSWTGRDTIRFDESLTGTIVLDGEALDLSGELTIETTGDGRITIDADSRSRVMNVDAGTDVVLRGIAIQNGTANRGAGIFNSGNLTLDACTVSGNVGVLAPEDVDSSGGGVFNRGTLTVQDSVFEANGADDGAGIYNHAGEVTVTSSAICANQGGGIRSHSGILSVIRSSVSRNQGEGIGGYNAIIDVVNSVVSQNADGGIDVTYGELTVTNSTVYQNRSDDSGGGVRADRSTLRLFNTIVAQNLAEDAPDLFVTESSGEARGSFIGNGSGQTFVVDGEGGNQVGSAESPLDPKLGEGIRLEDGRIVHYPLPGSPLLNVGDNTAALDAAGEPLTVDILGQPRVQDGTVDIGAIEGDFASTQGITYEVTSLDAGLAEDGVLTFWEAYFAATENRPVGDAPAGSWRAPDTIRFTESLSGTIHVAETILLYGNLAIETAESNEIVFDAASQCSVFEVWPYANITLAGVTVTGGHSSHGAGIHNAGNLTLIDATVRDNTGLYGAGVKNEGTLAVENSDFTNNVALNYSANHSTSFSYGGAIYNSGVMTVHNSRFTDNFAFSGGAIHNVGTMTATNSSFARNIAVNDGWVSGGGAINNSGTANIVSSVFSANLAYDGGGISNKKEARIDNCLFVNNHAMHGGGAVHHDSTHDLVLTNSTLSGNASVNYGGGFYKDISTSSATLHNVIIAGNTASRGPDLYAVGTVTASHCLIGDGKDSSLTGGTNGNLVGTTAGPIDPLFVRNPSLGPDGIWRTDDDDLGDLRLRLDSPAVDTGDNTRIPNDRADLDADGDTSEPLPLDLEGNPRVHGDIVDMGAYECMLAPVQVPGDLNGDGAVNSDDLNIVRANWGCSVTPGSLIDGDPTGDGVVNSDDLNIVRANWGTHAPAATAAATEKSPASSATGDESETEAVDRSDSAPKMHTLGNDAAMRNWDPPRAAWLEAVKALETGPDTPARTAKVRRAVDLILEGLV